MNIKFKKSKDSVLNKLFLKLTYMSGDADAYEYEEVEIEGVTYNNYLENLDKIEKEVNNYKLIGRLTDINDLYDEGKTNYESIEKQYGKDIADIYDNVPGDSTSNWQFKAHLSNIEIHAYNEKGELLTSYV